jgi:hypothetical protein
MPLQAGAIDKAMQGLLATDRLWQNGQTSTPAAQRGVSGDGNIDVEHIGNRSQQAFGLPQRLVKHQAQHEAGLDSSRRIDRLTAALSGGWRMPCRHRLLGEPDRQASPLYQSGIILRPIRQPISRLGKLVTAAFVEFVRHEFPKRSRRNGSGLPYRPGINTAIHAPKPSIPVSRKAGRYESACQDNGHAS